MARPTTLPQQAIDHAAEQAQPHLPTELPPEHDAFDFALLEQISPGLNRYFPGWFE